VRKAVWSDLVDRCCRSVRRQTNNSSMHVETLPMVSFFRARAPDVVKSVRVVPAKHRTEEENNDTDGVISIVNDRDNDSGYEREESVVGVEYSKVSMPVCVSLQRPLYLFSGKLEVHVVEDQLFFVIKKYTGEWAGTIKYGCVRDEMQTRRMVDLRRRKVIKTVSHVKEERYFVYVNYGAGKYVALKMELCPGDEIIMEELIVQYGSVKL
jgi:hypothetical protein